MTFPTPPDIPEGSTLWGAGSGLIVLLLWLRRRLSRDKVEVSKDSAEVNLIAVLQQERDNARQGEAEARKREEQAWTARNNDAKLIGELTAQVKHQSEVIELLQQQVASLRKDLHNLREELQKKQLLLDLQTKGAA